MRSIRRAHCKAMVCLFGLLALSTVGLCQNTPYCKAIQKGAPTQIQPKQFKQMEEVALREYARPEPYELRAISFGNTTEKVWAVIYGEVFCNLSSDRDRATHMGALVFEWYDKSLSSRGNSVSANLMENAEARKNSRRLNLNSRCRFSWQRCHLGATPSPYPFTSCPTFARISGHFEAYNYWLFQSARPDEFNQWLGQHQAQFQAWLDWRSQNKFAVSSPDFQRRHILKGQ